MRFEWDERKRKQNLAKRGLDFALVHEMEWGSALRLKDERCDYGEIRYLA